MDQQLDDLAAHLALLARSRTGRLAALTLGAPSEILKDDVCSGLRDRLAGLGHPAVEVSSQPAGGPLRVLWVEFAR